MTKPTKPKPCDCGRPGVGDTIIRKYIVAEVSDDGTVTDTDGNVHPPGTYALHYLHPENR